MIVALLRNFISFLKKNSRCEVYDEFLLKSFDGYVFNKYIDHNEHEYKTVIIKNHLSTKNDTLLFTFDTTNLFERININDTLRKEMYNDSIFIIRSNEKVFLDKMDFGCSR